MGDRGKVMLRVAFLVVLIAVITLVSVFHKEVGDTLKEFLDWVRDAGALGPFVFFLVYIVGTVLFLPGLILTCGAGFVFSKAFGFGIGFVVSVVVVWCGATVGACLAFLLGRYVFRERVAQYAEGHAKFAALEAVMNEEGRKMVFLLRLSPLVPFNFFNYAAGLTSVKFRDYAVASLGMIPGTMAYCGVGATLGSLTDVGNVGLFSGGPWVIVLVVLGTLLAVLAVVYISRLARRRINQALVRSADEVDNHPDSIEHSVQDLRADGSNQ
ncbi:MAG: hypothetical protein MHM6MM_005806 [Cercozoa sp. M6MM]